MKKTISIVLALLAVFSSFISPAVFAAEPHTYIVRYVPEKREWRSQKLSSWDNSEENYNMDYLWGNLQDGDTLTISGDENSPTFGDLKIVKKLAKLTLYAVRSGIIVYSESAINEVYVLKGTSATLNGQYDTIYVYDDSSCEINNDVSKLQISGETCMKMNVTAHGMVGYCQIDDRGNVIYTVFNAEPDTLKVVDGVLQESGKGSIITPDIPVPVPVPASVGEEPKYSFWDKIINFLKRIWSFIVTALHIPELSVSGISACMEQSDLPA